jgi:ABC-type glycerol-3-phosphate transport system substrate-binding protein
MGFLILMPVGLYLRRGKKTTGPVSFIMIILCGAGRRKRFFDIEVFGVSLYSVFNKRGRIMRAQKGFIVLFMLMVFVLAAGCGQSGRGSGGKAPEKVVALTVWGDLSNHAALADCFRDINTAFAKQYPNIALDHGYASVEDIDAAYRSDSLPDLFYVQGNKSSSRVDGVTYCGYPVFLEATPAYYNADIFAAQGLKKPAAYGEFTAAAETLFAAGISPFALGGGFEWSRYWSLQTLCSSLANNGEAPGCLFPGPGSRSYEQQDYRG